METDIGRIATAHFQELVADERWCSARFITYIHRETGAKKDHIIAAIGIFLFVYLCAGPNARFVCNALLAGVPIIVIFLYPNEKPKNEYMALFGLTTTFDDSLDQKIPSYYFFKFIAHLLLFLRPFEYAKKITDFIDEKKCVPAESKDMSECKTQMSTMSSVKKARTSGEIGPARVKQEGQDGAAPGEPGQEAGAKDNVEGADDGAARIASRCDVTSNERIRPAGTNPMLFDSNYRLNATSSNSSLDSNISYDAVGPGQNLNDFITWPMSCLVFNAPFDGSLTYHMKAKNNAYHKMAYAGNCIDRVSVYPPSGLIEPQTSFNIAVKCQPFDTEHTDVSKDRFVFEYVLVPKETEKFSFKLLQTADTRRRKNILVKYNL